MLDYIDLPFADADDGGVSSSDVRYLALARESVLAELSRTDSLKTAWSQATDASAAAQERNAAEFSAFLSALQAQLRAGRPTSASPISGSSRLGLLEGSRGRLDPVVVAAPPITLRHSALQQNPQADTTAVYQQSQSETEAEEAERPLLALSSTSLLDATPAWTPQLTASQSSLDGVFFEALVSQHLSLTLWMQSADPQETLRELLADGKQVEENLCAERAVIEYVNAARYAEQRAFKRRRDEVLMQSGKSREKVLALEKLLGVQSEGEASVSTAASERLRRWLQE